MVKKGLVAIVGRPNVGKSSLFNRLIKEKKSIVDDLPGVTRDRIYGTTEWLTRAFTLIDTGGITLEKTTFAQEIKFQAELAISEADVIVFVLDSKKGFTPDDQLIAKILYKTQKPIILVANKYDKKASDFQLYDFLSLGFGEPIGISATHGIGIGDLLDQIIKQMPVQSFLENSQVPRLAIIGKPNVGKSSLVNSALGEPRMIISSIPGTTLDSVDSLIRYQNKEYLLIDTAGIRRKGKIEEGLEKYSYLRALKAIINTDIVLLMLDVTLPISDQDTNIGGLAAQENKPVIIILNKWDLIKDKAETRRKKEAEVRAYFKYLQYAKVLFISAHEKQKITQIYEAVDQINTMLHKKIQTSVFNEVLNRAQLLNPAPEHQGGRLKIYYGSQVSAYLPTFVMFVNNPHYIHFSYKRFLENQIRAQFGFEGVPITLIFRERR